MLGLRGNGRGTSRLLCHYARHFETAQTRACTHTSTVHLRAFPLLTGVGLEEASRAHVRAGA